MTDVAIQPRKHRDRSIPAVAKRLRERGAKVSTSQLRRACDLGEVKTDSFGGIRRIGQAEEERIADLLAHVEAE
jgi:hypothetical protein